MKKLICAMCTTAILFVVIAVPAGATTGNYESSVLPSSSSERVPTDSGYFECSGNNLVKELGINYSTARHGDVEVERYASFHVVPNQTDGNVATDTWNVFKTLGDFFRPELDTVLIYNIPIVGGFFGSKSHAEDIRNNMTSLYTRYWKEFVACKSLDPGIRNLIFLNRIRTLLDRPVELRKLHYVKSAKSIYLQLICHLVGGSIPVLGNIFTGQTWDLEGYRSEPPSYNNIAELALRYQCGW